MTQANVVCFVDRHKRISRRAGLNCRMLIDGTRKIACGFKNFIA
jgi:hypothetical protein